MIKISLRKRGYRQVSLPIELIKKIENFIKSRPDLGFTSIPEFIRYAIREKLEQFEEKES
ncbi:MAG: ribbon-helix-helix domain-containing protein [Candidatus Helarchaeota archaeon]